MAEMIWNALVSVYNFIMDNIVLINIFLALVIVFFSADPRRLFGHGRFCFILYRSSDLLCI